MLKYVDSWYFVWLILIFYHELVEIYCVLQSNSGNVFSLSEMNTAKNEYRKVIQFTWIYFFQFYRELLSPFSVKQS